MIDVGIVGGAGYTGGELIRLLLHHPQINLKFVNSKSQHGKKITEVHTDLFGETEIEFISQIISEVDLVIFALNHGETREYLFANTFSKKTKFIDLSQDFRLKINSDFNSENFIYGLPELNRDKIKIANKVANPGCFATAIELALLPLAKENLLSEVFTTGITGSTGAGQSLQATSHYSWRHDNIEAYKTLSHQHLNEVIETLSLNGSSPKINFVPWRGNFTRGIYTSSVLKIEKYISELTNIYKNYYKTHPFVFVSENMINMKQVVNSNKAFLFLEKVEDKLIVHSAIDNLLKGACGQAIQNMNLMFGFEETVGLKLKASAF